jgi:plasmid stability protein
MQPDEIKLPQRAGGAMPVLHVRNVPEDLYEAIRHQADIQKRSISQQVIYLLERVILEDRTE